MTPGTVFVFDYDGVIADTEPLHWKSWAVMLSRYNMHLEWEEYQKIGVGVDDAHLYEVLLASARAPEINAFFEFNRERKEMVRKWSMSGSPIRADTAEMLQKLGGRAIGLVTSSERSEVEPVLRAAKILDRFDALVFGGEAALPKPSAAPYELIAARLGIKAGIAFEDSEPGLESARAAGFRVVKVTEPSELPKLVARILADEEAV